MLFVLFGLLILLSIVIWSILNGIAPMPSSPKAKQALLKALPPTLTGVAYELGAGWGTLLIPLSRHYEQVVGFETSPFPFLVARARMILETLSNVKLYRRDFFKANLQDAGLIVCYLYPKAMARLKGKFEQELRPGTWVISNTFAIPGWEPDQVIEVGDLYRTKIYVYIFKK